MHLEIIFLHLKSDWLRFGSVNLKSFSAWNSPSLYLSEHLLILRFGESVFSPKFHMIELLQGHIWDISVFMPSFSRSKSYQFRTMNSIRILLAVTLTVFVFVAPMSARVRVAKSTSTSEKIAASPASLLQSSNSGDADKKPEKNKVDGFIIEMINGVSTCRAATLAEVPSTLPRPGDRAVPVRDLLPDSKNQSFIHGGQNSSTGLTINLLALPQLAGDPNNATVMAAFQRAAAVWTARIKSPVTISIKIDYGVNRANGTPFPSNAIGSTSSGSISIDYPSARDRLILTASSPGETGIYNSLPTSVIPNDTVDGSVVSISRSLTQPLGFLPLNPDDVVATISFNKNFAFDFNPDDGIDSGAIDFVAVAAHEIGHALGFISNAGEGSTAQVSLWDMFRFRPGTTSSTFGTAQRIMSTGGGQVYFTGQTFVVGGAGTNELGLSTGGPEGTEGDRHQSSHWKDDSITGEYIGIMDPTIATGVHEGTTENDFSTLETLGWNLVDSTSPPAPPPPPANDNFANAQVISGCSGSVIGTNLNATKEVGEPNHLAPDDGGGSRSVWYTWQAPSSGSVTVTTAGSGFDTVLALYTGTAVNALNLLVNDDDIPDVPGQPHITTSSVTFTASAGTIYRIAVDGFNNGGSGGDMGPIKLNWNEANCVDSSIQFFRATATVVESAGSAVIDVTRTGNLSNSATIGYFTSDGTATVFNQDYSPTSGVLSFAPGEVNKTIVVPINNDLVTEPSETFNVTINNPSNSVTLGTPSTVVVTITDDDAGPNTVQFSASPASATETPNATTKVSLTVFRTGDTSAASSVNYATSDVTASERSDYLATIGTLRFAANETSKTIPVFIVDDSYGEGPETFNVTLSNAVSCTLGSPATVTVTINSDESVDGLNPVKDGSFSSDFFVRQQYVDFFNREADPEGLSFWKNEIDGCTTQACREIKRINVSAAFFVSIEFKETGYLVYKAYQASFNTGEFLKLRNFLSDTQEIGRGVIISQPGATQQLETNKQKFFNDFVQRPAFLQVYPTTMPAAEFVDKLNANTFDPRNPGAGALTQNERDALVAQLSFAPSNAEARATALRTISENALFGTRQLNKAFVLMQYFGYLRRNPNDPPERGLDFAGYNFWLGKLNQFNGNYIAAEMVKAFLVSDEYINRFGP